MISLLVITTVIILLFVILIFLILWLYNRKQIKVKRDFEVINLSLEKTLLSMQLEIQENTFRKISQEIHDNISLTLALSKLNLNILASESDKDRSKIENSVDLISKALIDLNDISKSMDSEIIKTHGLIHALEAELAVFSRTGKFEINFNVHGEFVFMDSERELILYRIVQEACNNILKHSFASCINLTLSYSTNYLNLVVSDNGVGYKAEEIKEKGASKRGLGLNNIKNRAKMLNADFKIESIPGTGTTLTLIMPLEKQNNLNGTISQSRLS